MAEIFFINITCPECATLFEIDVTLLGTEGRRVSCSECGHQWLQKASLEEKKPDYAPDVFEEKRPTEGSVTHDAPPLNDLEEEDVLKEKASFLTRQFFLIPVLLCLIFTGLFFGRNDVVRFMPGMEKFYSALGISAYNIRAFQFSNTQWQLVQNGTHRSIEITGNVTNTSQKLLVPPTIRVTVRGQGICETTSWIDQLLNTEQTKNKACTIRKWAARLKEGRLFSGQTTSFKAVYPLGTNEIPTEVLVKFVNKEN